MIPVQEQPEPGGFDRQVRQPGRHWLQKQGITAEQEIERRPKWGRHSSYWRECLPDLHRSYSGVCAYLCIYCELEVGGMTVDHFVPKSRRPMLAYEWSNYRLACSRMNGRKSDSDAILDPFCVAPGTFCLELVSGRIYVSPNLAGEARRLAEETQARLKLDDPGLREVRARHFQDYSEGAYTEGFLRAKSPFVWFEARRQGLL